MILIISHPADGHTQVVAEALRQRGKHAALLDFSRFPARSTIALRFGSEQSMRLRDGQWGDIALDECRAVWWRRPQPFGIPSEITDPVHRMFATSEAREVFGGLSGLLDAHWVNVPERDDAAHRKVAQLRTADRLGIPIPDTLVTSDPVEAQAFIRGRGARRTVFKAFSGTPQAWRETRLVGDAELEKLDLLRHAPVIFQDYVDGIDIRVTVVGDRVFPAAIDIGDGDYAIDFRMNYDHLGIREIDLPEPVQRNIRRLMDRLGLVYGAIDFRRTPDDQYVFLEVNPAGQWLFVEHRTGQPITEAMTDLLITLDHDEATRPTRSNLRETTA